MNGTTFDAANKVWYGPEYTLKIEKDKSLGELLLEKLTDADQNRVVQINGDNDTKMTVGELRTYTIRCAQNLIKLGCRKNDRITVVARNTHHLTPLTIAAICIGAPLSPLDVILMNDGITPFLERIRPKFIVCDTDVVVEINKLIKEIGFEAKIFTANGIVDGFDPIEDLLKETGNENEFKCTPIDDVFQHTGVIACSSGSTGMPKSILMPHALLIHIFFNAQSKHALNVLCFSSLYWFSGIWTLINPVTTLHTRIFTSKPFASELFIELATKYKVQFFIGPPSQVQAIFKSNDIETADLSSLLFFLSIGAHIPLALLQMLKKYLPKCFLITGFGMTEVGGGVTYTMPNELDDNSKTAGKLASGVKMKILDEHTGEKKGVGEEGEICVKGPVMSTGYYANEEATKNGFDSEGFCVTGDLGYFDEKGYLYVIGRKKEIFKNCGFAVWPIEIENIILKHPSVHDACVVSVYDDVRVTELPAAIVVKKVGHEVTKEEIYKLVADQLAEYKRLDGGIYFVDALPMTPSHKIMKSKAKLIAQKLYENRS